MDYNSTILADYVPMSWPTSTDQGKRLLKFCYTKIGSQLNPQYYIMNATAQTFSNYTDQHQYMIFVEYEEVPNTV
jgi:hypothetical protein